MLINNYLKSIKDNPETDINNLTDIRDNGTLHIPGDIPTLQCILGRQLPGTDPDIKFKYDIIFEPGFLEIKNTKHMCVQVYTTKTNKFKRFKSVGSSLWSNWTLSYSSNNKSTLTVKGVMNEALVKSYILKNYIKYDPTEIIDMTNLKVDASLLNNKITRNGDVSSGTIALGNIVVDNGNVHFYGDGMPGIYAKISPTEIRHLLSIGGDNVLRTGSHQHTRTVFESVNRPRIVMPGVVDKGAILIQADLAWKVLYNSGNPNAGVAEVGLPNQMYEFRSWNKSGNGDDNFAHQYHGAKGARVGSSYNAHMRAWDEDGEIEHSVQYDGGNRLYVTWNQAGDCQIYMVMWR